jgi:hypothetical protein
MMRVDGNFRDEDGLIPEGRYINSNCVHIASLLFNDGYNCRAEQVRVYLRRMLRINPGIKRREYRRK